MTSIADADGAVAPINCSTTDLNGSSSRWMDVPKSSKVLDGKLCGEDILHGS